MHNLTNTEIIHWGKTSSRPDIGQILCKITVRPNKPYGNQVTVGHGDCLWPILTECNLGASWQCIYRALSGNRSDVDTVKFVNVATDSQYTETCVTC